MVLFQESVGELVSDSLKKPPIHCQFWTELTLRAIGQMTLGGSDRCNFLFVILCNINFKKVRQ